ncbi:MAG: hypothetical protein IT292_09010 [Deltaproteobacteria bacterium]|nr:hypothetical protein [Deltaproteobacteria bacterium]
MESIFADGKVTHDEEELFTFVYKNTLPDKEYLQELQSSGENLATSIYQNERLKSLADHYTDLNPTDQIKAVNELNRYIKEFYDLNDAKITITNDSKIMLGLAAYNRVTGEVAINPYRN